MKNLLKIALPIAGAAMLAYVPGGALAYAEDASSLPEASSGPVPLSSESPTGTSLAPEESSGEGGNALDEAISYVSEKLDGLDLTAALGTSIGSLVSAAVSALFWLVYRKVDKKWKKGVEDSEAASGEALREIAAKVEELTALVEQINKEKDESLLAISAKYDELVREVTEKSEESYKAFYEAASKLEAYSNVENRLAEIERLIRMIAESPLGVATGLAKEVKDGE